jgi:hypothetical protein
VELLEQVECGAVGQEVVGERDIEGRGCQHLLRGSQRFTRRHLEARSGQVIADRKPNGWFVVDQENPIATDGSECRVHA